MYRRREKATKMATKNPIKFKDNFVEALDEFSDDSRAAFEGARAVR